jgi:dihydroorotase
VFEQENALDKLEGFLSLNGAAFYGLPVNSRKLELIRAEAALDAPEKLRLAAGEITHFDPMMALHWRVNDL